MESDDLHSYCSAVHPWSPLPMQTLGICMAFIVAASVATMAPTRGELEALEQP